MSKEAQKKNGSKRSQKEDFGGYEFGGPMGTGLLILWSHYILYYFWYCYEYHNGQMYIPTSIGELVQFPLVILLRIRDNAWPTTYSLLCYGVFFCSQLLLAAIVPGPMIEGIAAVKEKKLPYLINGYYCYYITLFFLSLLHFFGIFRLESIVTNFGVWLTTSVIYGDMTSLLIYLYGIVSKQSIRMSGNHVYDFFMGSLLYPRMFGDRVDIKMISEVRWSWLSLFVITLSCVFKSWQQYHTVTPNLLFLLFAHWLYSNACVKGEHYIPYFWDMYYEKYGWMLNFWNITGVPFLYCFQSLYVLRNHGLIVELQRTHSIYYMVHVAACLVLLCAGYYIWDCANGQKADFKNPQLRKFTKFPNLPHSTIDNAKYIQTHDGRKLMVDGFWKYARKMNYTGDICMALSWGLICHFGSPLPFFYVTFFVAMALHRFRRDDDKCAKNYGKKWEEYKKVVPYMLIPGII